jgi:hypothetical protein
MSEPEIRELYGGFDGSQISGRARELRGRLVVDGGRDRR